MEEEGECGSRGGNKKNNKNKTTPIPAPPFHSRESGNLPIGGQRPHRFVLLSFAPLARESGDSRFRGNGSQGECCIIPVMILKNYGCVWYHIGRKAVRHFDDMDMTDECQLDVYLYALGLMKKHGLRSVADVGCGSAYKLITYLGDYDTLGLEVAANIPALRERYPGRQFAESDFQGKPPAADVVICSDVIEHLTDPDVLLDFLRRATCRFLIIATPIRIDKLRFLWQKPIYFTP